MVTMRELVNRVTLYVCSILQEPIETSTLECREGYNDKQFVRTGYHAF
jgi:hypothetical protein